MNNDRLVSLAAGVVQEFAPEDVVYAASEAGFNAVGVWCDLATWTEARTAKVKTALKTTGLTALDIEVVWFKPGEAIDCHDTFVEIAKEIGAKNILCVSSEPNISDTKTRFAHLCQRAEGSGIRIALEFLAITEINSLSLALQVVNDVDHPLGAILIDALHLFRTGSSIDDLKTVAPYQLPYLQLCDATAQLLDASPGGVLEDAIALRRLPGDGELPLRALLQSFEPTTPISLEIRSRALSQQYPDVTERAKAVFNATLGFFEKLKAS